MNLLKHWMVIALLTIWAGIACAHPAPFSYLDLHIDSSGVHGSLVVHDFDAAHEFELSRPESLLDPATASAQRSALIGLLEPRLRISGDAALLPLHWGHLEVLTDRQSMRLSFKMSDQLPGKLEINARLFPYDMNHQSFINIHEDGKLTHQAILDAQHQYLIYYTGTLQGRWSLVHNFIKAGVHHILIGPDHILFLIGLLLLGGALWKQVSIVTAFTIGHSITLSLAVLGLVSIAPAIVEPLIALSIMVVGADNLLIRALHSRPMHDASATAAMRDLRPWLAGSFGLIHGFGFAAVLMELGLPRAALGWSLAAFNVGVELGQLFIVLTMATLLAWLRRHNTVLAERCVLLGSIGVIAAGVCWFVQRVWFTSVT